MKDLGTELGERLVQELLASRGQFTLIQHRETGVYVATVDNAVGYFLATGTTVLAATESILSMITKEQT